MSNEPQKGRPDGSKTLKGRGHSKSLKCYTPKQRKKRPAKRPYTIPKYLCLPSDCTLDSGACQENKCSLEEQDIQRMPIEGKDTKDSVFRQVLPRTHPPCNSSMKEEVGDDSVYNQVIPVRLTVPYNISLKKEVTDISVYDHVLPPPQNDLHILPNKEEAADDTVFDQAVPSTITDSLVMPMKKELAELPLTLTDCSENSPEQNNNILLYEQMRKDIQELLQNETFKGFFLLPGDSIHLAQLYTSKNPGIKWSIEIDRNWSVSIQVHRQVISAEHEFWFSNSRQCASVSALQRLLNALQKCNVCVGNYEENMMALIPFGSEPSRGPGLTSYREEDFGAVCRKHKYSTTIRSEKCPLLLKRGFRCFACQTYRGTLRKKISTLRKKANRFSRHGESVQLQFQLAMKDSTAYSVMQQIHKPLNDMPCPYHTDTPCFVEMIKTDWHDVHNVAMKEEEADDSEFDQELPVTRAEPHKIQIKEEEVDLTDPRIVSIKEEVAADDSVFDQGLPPILTDSNENGLNENDNELLYVQMKKDIQGLLQCRSFNRFVLLPGHNIHLVQHYISKNPGIKWSIEIDKNWSVSLQVHQQVISAEHEFWFSNSSTCSSVIALQRLLQALQRFNVCVGNYDKKMISLFRKPSRGPGQSCYREGNFGAVCNDHQYSSTIRSEKCSLLLKRGVRCFACQTYRGALRKKLSTLRQRKLCW